MVIPPRPVRRLLAPLVAAFLVVLMAGFVLAAVTGAVAAVFDRRRRLLRTALFALAYAAMEVVVLVAAGGLWLRRPRVGRLRSGSEAAWITAHQRLLESALGWVLGAAHRCFGFDVVVTDTPTPDALVASPPVLVLARHGGPGDSFALVHLLLTRYRRQVRIVLKEILQLDPVLDVLLNRLGSCFIPTGAGEHRAERLADLARQLGPLDALLLFPEGGNWTPVRRRRSIRRLRSNDDASGARRAALMTHVLPPRPGGVLACLDAHPGLGVVIVAHAGLDRIVSIRQAWDRLPLAQPMTVRLWPAAVVPDGNDARLTWLTTEWATVDEWIDARHAEPGPS